MRFTPVAVVEQQFNPATEVVVGVGADRGEIRLVLGPSLALPKGLPHVGAEAESVEGIKVGDLVGDNLGHVALETRVPEYSLIRPCEEPDSVHRDKRLIGHGQADGHVAG